MKTTTCFNLYVMAERPYLSTQKCQVALQQAIINPIKRIIQTDGRIYNWVYITEEKKFLRVITLSDGETIHTAFFDRNFKE